jgi:hypothetical protein
MQRRFLSTFGPLTTACVLLAQVACTRGDDEPADGTHSGGSSGASGKSGATGGSSGSSAGGSAGATAGAGGSAGQSGSTGSGGTGTGGSAATGGGGSGGSAGKPTLPDGRGATVPFTEYEAETMETNGVVLQPTRAFTQVASEASGRQAVRLSNTGDFVKFTNQSASNSIVVRYSIPDGGADYWTTLSVYVNDQPRGQLSLTSRYSWTYGGDDDFNHPDQNNPGRGTPHHFFDEARALIGDIPVGASVMLRKDGGDTASEYVIDLVDMEPVPGPLAKPQGFLSLTEDCGGTADDASDDSGALQHCIDRVQGEGRPGLYLPPGEFRSLSDPLSVANITIRGAGMWHTTVSGFHARFDCWGDNCKYYDFSVSGDTILRDDNSPETAFGGNGSSGAVLENIWIEHTKTGYWTGADTDGLVIKSCRIRNLFADAVNFYGGTSNSVVENTHARNTGDDAFASWSPSNRAVNRNNVFRHNYVQVPWKANCFAIYGGENNVIEDNVCADVVQYPGILLARQFGSHPFTGRTRIDRNSLIRAGGSAYNQKHGAIKLHASEGPLQNIEIDDLDIVEPTHSGIHVQGQQFIDSVWFDNVEVFRPGTAGFHLTASANGAMDASHVVLTEAPAGVIDDSDGKFTILKGEGNTGW